MRKSIIFTMLFFTALSLILPIFVLADTNEVHWAYTDYVSLKEYGMVNDEVSLDLLIPNGYFLNLLLSVASTPEIASNVGDYFNDESPITRAKAVSLVTSG